MVKPRQLERLEKLLSFGINFLIIIAICSCVGFYMFYKQKSFVEEVAQNRINSILIANELRQTSDDLTRLASNYVTSENPIYKDQYFEIVKIRNGEKPRPSIPVSYYLDRLTESGIQTISSSGKPFSLIQIAKNAGIEADEVKILMATKTLSDNLALREEKAFNEINKKNKQMASNLMFDEQYAKEKSDILFGINNFYKLLNTRTQREVDAQERSLGNISFIMMLLFVLASIDFVIVIYAYKKINDIATDTYKQIEEYSVNLTHLNDSKNKFFSIIAHDIRSPFNGFLGMTHMLANEVDKLSKEEIQYFGQTMEKSASNLYEFLENLLDWANIETGISISKPEILNFKNITKANIDLHQNLAANKNITIKNFIPDNTLVFVDERMINIVLRNLLTNAIKFTPRDGYVEIGIVNEKETNNQKTFYVKDNGIGMSETDIYDIFRITKKTSNVGTEGEKGTGLGLILCKQFIEKNNGKIWAESNLSKGSTFYFSLPITHQV